MRRFKKILAIYGENSGADDVLSRADNLACANDAEVTLFEVIPAYRVATTNHLERSKRLDRLAQTLRASRVNSKFVAGTPYQEIIKEVLRSGYDLVIIGADSGTTMRDRFFGDTAKELMRKCPCPVWALKPAQPEKASRILACVNPPIDTEAVTGIDRKIVELATSLAKMKQAELHVIHAWDILGKDAVTIRSEVRDCDYEKIITKHERKYRRRVVSLINEVASPDLEYTLHMHRLAPHAAITKVVDDWDVDLVVMGTVCRSGIHGLIVGNSAERVLHSLHCSVFTVKPQGFMSPIILERALADA